MIKELKRCDDEESIYTDEDNDFFEVKQLNYYIEENCFTDCDGFIVYNIFEYIRPSDLFLFKFKKEYMLIERPDSGFVELMYPDPDEDF
jgi:hypothetical protein